MAEFVNPIGKVRGKIGNLVAYVRKDGKNCCKSASFRRKPCGEVQKRQSVAFGTTTGRKQWLMKAIRAGFPGGNGYPKGYNGFVSANMGRAVEVVKVHPEEEVKPRKKAGAEFRGVLDYGKLRVAAGRLAVPAVAAEVESGGAGGEGMASGGAVAGAEGVGNGVVEGAGRAGSGESAGKSPAGSEGGAGTEAAGSDGFAGVEAAGDGVAAGREGAGKRVRFSSQGMAVESVDCFLDDKIYGVVGGVRSRLSRMEELGTRGEAFERWVEFPQGVTEEELVVYVFAVRGDGRDASDSVCLRAPAAEG